MSLSIAKKSPVILIADDDISTRILLRLILKREGYQVIGNRKWSRMFKRF